MPTIGSIRLLMIQAKEETDLEKKVERLTEALQQILNMLDAQEQMAQRSSSNS
jgi:Ni,Fe-hydrogenase III large subunit